MPNKINYPIPQDTIGENFRWRDWFQKLSDKVYGSMAAQDSNDVDVTGGVIDGTVIGGTTPAAGTFTTVNATTGNITNVNTDYVQFNPAAVVTSAVGKIWWDGNGTLNMGMAGGNVVQHVGEDQFFYIKASATITKGQVIMFTGAVGASGVPTGAPATGITDGTYIMGIAAENIANNAFGFVQCFGVLRNVNTSGFADGDILWYNPAVTGGLTKVKPLAPNVKVQMAAVIKGGSAGGGTIVIRIDPGSILGGTDSNVGFGTLGSGQTIIYDASLGYWRNATLTQGTGITITNGAGSITITNAAPMVYPGAGIPVSTGTAWGTSKTAPTGAIVGTTDTQTLTNKTLTGYTETVFALSGTTPALSPNNGTIQTWTLTGNSTPTAGTWAAGQSIVLMIDDGTAYTVTWTSLPVSWVGGSAPTLSTTGQNVIVLWKVGTTIYGNYVGAA